MIEYKNRFNAMYFVLCLFLALSTSCKVTAQGDQPKKAVEKFRAAYYQLDLQNYAEAESQFKALIKKYPTYYDVYDALAKTYQKQRKYPEAIANYRTLLVHRPADYFGLYELGKIYMNLEQFDSAKYFYSYFLKEHGSKDANSDRARAALGNIDFIKEAKKNPVDISPVNLGNKINSGLEEYSPAFTIDEKTIYITHRDPKYQNEDIYYAYKENGEWTQAKPIGSPINTADNEGAFSVSADGRYIFFTSCKRPGGVGQCDLWLTIDKNGRWTDPVNLGPVINSRNWESQPSLASNGKDLYFTSDRSGGFGGTDLYHSSFSDTGWSKPRNLGPTINTSRDEQFPFIHPDGNTLYFSSEGHPGMGKSDLFITRKLPGNKWADPENLGFPINSAGNDWNLVVSRDGKTAYYSSDKLKEGFGGMDIYSFQLPENLQAKQVNYASGVVKDFNTKVPLGAVVLLTPLDGSTPTRTIAPERTGSFMVALVANTRYALTIEKRGYLFHSEYFDMPNSTADKPFELEIFLKTIEVGNSIVLKNVFFDTDKFDLKVESNTELDKLAELLNSNSTLKIQIGGHTDNQGSESQNITLSKNRANAVFNYLISKGITGSRMTFKGFGASQPIASNETKEGRALNRRTEFKIVD